MNLVMFLKFHFVNCFVNHNLNLKITKTKKVATLIYYGFELKSLICNTEFIIIRINVDNVPITYLF